MNIQSVPVGDSFKAIDVSPGKMLVRAAPDARSGVADIIVNAGGKESRLVAAAEARVLEVGRSLAPEGGSRLGAELRFVRLQREVVLVLGVREVFALDLRAGDARVTLRRFRDDADDHGFYREELVELPDGCVLVYEGGIARVTSTGDTRWHVAITWNDQHDRVDGDAMHFVREERDGSINRWSIDLRDGSKS